MKSLQSLIGWTILTSRRLMVIVCLGLVAALALYAVAFVATFRHMALEIFTLIPTDATMAMLGPIDAALVASLIVMVPVSGYADFVGRDEDEALNWIGKPDKGTLKVKLAASIAGKKT